MFINFKKYLIAGLMLFAVSSILWASDSFAEEVFENLTTTGWNIFAGMRRIIWGAAGFGIIAVCIGGLFGALNWKWLTAIIVGLVVIGLTAGIVSYLTQGTGADVSVTAISDTLM
jgi:type IV secretory pathway VirB2 component (pilin)